MLSLLGNAVALSAAILSFYILFGLIYKYHKYGPDRYYFDDEYNEK